MLTWLWTRLSEAGPQVTISGRALRRFPEREVDRLLRAQVLVEQQKSDSWSICAHCECGLDARPVREIGGELRACCPYDAAEDVVLNEDDLTRFSINAERLAAAIAASGGLTGGVAQIANGVWLIGTASTGCAVVLCCDPESLVAPGVILAIKAAAGGAPVAVVADAFEAGIALRLRESDVAALILGEVMTTSASGVERLTAGRITGDAPVVEMGVEAAAPAAARLQISRSRQAVRFDGRDIILSLNEFKCFFGAAEMVAMGQVMLTYQEIHALTNRASHRDVINELRDKLQKQGLSRQQAFDLVKTVHGRGLTIGLPEHEIDIRD